jgi:hypothetical protein
VELMTNGADASVLLLAIGPGAGLRVGELLARAVPEPWLGFGLMGVFLTLLVANGLNVARALRAAPPALLARVASLLCEGQLRQLRELCEADDGAFRASLRVGLAGDPEALDRSAVLQAWRALQDRYEWWPKSLIAFGLAVGITAFPLLALHATRLVIELSNRFAEAWTDPPVRTALRSFAESVILTGTLAGLVFAASVAAGLVFLQVVRRARHRATARVARTLSVERRRG